MYGDELSDFFEDRILDNYSTDAEDGSCREVADKIVRQFAGGIPSSSSLELAEAAVVPKCRRVRAREALSHRPSHLRGSRRGSRHRPSPRAPRRLRRAWSVSRTSSISHLRGLVGISYLLDLVLQRTYLVHMYAAAGALGCSVHMY